MDRVFNFSPGPSMLPLSVLEQAQKELLSFNGSGMSVMEMSHRSKGFDAVAERAQELLRSLMQIPAGYKVLFLQGGASMQFAQVPLNLGNGSKKADYIDSGNFASGAIKEAQRFVDVSVVASSQEGGYRCIPTWDASTFNPQADYFHITTNNTVYGTRFSSFPDTGSVPLVADASSNILSEAIDVSQFGLIYAGAQKNAGIAGVTIVIVREDLIGKVRQGTPTMLDYKAMADANSMYNTPCTFGLYISMLCFEHLTQLGGIEQMARINRDKAAIVYDALDASSFYKPYADTADRSFMNITFLTPSADLDDLFIKEAAQEGMTTLKGYRTVGGIRASMYNAMPTEGARALADFMHHFAQKNG